MVTQEKDSPAAESSSSKQGFVTNSCSSGTVRTGTDVITHMDRRIDGKRVALRLVLGLLQLQDLAHTHHVSRVLAASVLIHMP